ncbi:hypothetical protein CHF27_000170 [Romboutsia maritimum]|uniref:Uncharacterized protein n=1 Tax=Romboutsia maritimum TaxID=2020948 RepID=A0A371IVZ2_9FIRM|nr:hypothetical protein [Romboutsia maritimum]RDY24651.1 hypothetical protein CHF27_000170 [Romboutsia maritimum]
MNKDNYINESIKKLEIFSDSLSKIIRHPLILDENYNLTTDIKSNQNSLDYCELWTFIKYILIGWDENDPTISIEIDFISSNGLINELSEFLEELLCSSYIKNCAIKHEIKKFLCLLNCLESTIENINCNPNCKHLIGKLFCELVKIIIKLIDIIAKLIVLLIFCHNNSECNSNKNTVNSSFCHCLIHDLSKELSDLQKILDELGCLAIDFIKCSIKKCNFCKDDDCYNKKCTPEYRNPCDTQYDEHCNCYNKRY